MCTPVQMEAVLGMLAASDPEAPPETWRSYRQILNEGFASIDRRLEEYGPLEPERFNLEEANQRLAQREDLDEVAARMTFRVEVVCLHDGGEQRCSVLEMDRAELALETLGMSVAEGKAILHGIQDFVAAQQVIEDLKRRRVCPNCGQRYHSKDAGTHTVKTVFGAVEVPNPRWERCPCQTEGPRTFRPTTAWLQGARTSPEMLYLETKWASLIPFEKVVDLLKEVLPVAEATNSQTVREHLHAVAERIEEELGEERQPRDFATVEAIAELPLPDGPMTVGIDGGYVRAAHKQGSFEVIAGRSVVAFRRAEGDSVPPPKCFGFVQTYDQKPRQRLWEVMKSQGMQENQQVVFMSDGGEDVRQVQEYLHPNSEHMIDWFHITMRLTVLQQQTKALQAERPDEGASSSKQIESIKHLLWHGNVDEALDRIDSLFMDLDLISRQSAPADKLAAGIADLRTYIRNNRGSIPNYGERYRQGETISTAFVESTINQVVSRRFVKKQQMQWTLKGAHLLLQTRTKVLNNEFDDVFRRWFPRFRPKAQTTSPEQKAA